MDELLRRGLDDDGLFAPKIKEHSLEKIRIHNYYVSMFTTAMREYWHQLAYVGLFSGAGRAHLSGTTEYVETSAMGALRLRFPFTKYIFVDSDARCIEALEQRIGALPSGHDIALVHRDVSAAVPDVLAAMPSFRRDRTLLSFCFVDPFSAELDFEVIRRLGNQYRMDFLVLLMLGRDIRTNFKRYLENEEDERIGRLIDDPGWREDWRSGNCRTAT
jgi:three-Cys-motif partner protein